MRSVAQYLLVAWASKTERDGQPALALQRLLSSFGADPDSHFQHTTIGDPQWLPYVVRLSLDCHDFGTAEAATHACESEDQRQQVPECRAAARHCRGLLDADPAQVSGAANAFAELGFPHVRAGALEDAAVLYAERRDLDAARAAYNRAIAIYTDLDAAWDLGRADGRLRPYNIRRGHRGPRRRPTTGWLALTPTEVKVAHLVAAGLSNPEIAARLFLSRRTVETHVSHILTKLNADSRVGIARQATELAR